MKKLFAHFSGLGRKLLNLRDTPHAIAGGAAIGIFIGFTPLFGIKILLCLAVAYLLRCSRLAAVIAVSLHDVVTPFWPFLLTMEYDIGYWLSSHPHLFPPKLEMHHVHIAEIMQWTTFLHVGLPLLIGSLFFSAPAAAITYAIMFAFLKRREARRLAHENASEQANPHP